MCPFPSYFYSFSPCIFQLLMINDNDGELQQLLQKSCSFFVHRYVVMVRINLRTHTHKKATCSCSSVGLVGWEWWWVNVLVGMFLHWKKETWWYINCHHLFAIIMDKSCWLALERVGMIFWEIAHAQNNAWRFKADMQNLPGVYFLKVNNMLHMFSYLKPTFYFWNFSGRL